MLGSVVVGARNERPRHERSSVSIAYDRPRQEAERVMDPKK
jgi:hypothetical protein